MAAIPLMIELLGMPFNVALAVVLLNGILYLTHHMLGDPVVPGWITPAIPLIMAYVGTFPEGVERVHALVSFQMTLGILSIVLGVTGITHRVVNFVPAAIKSGIVLGAGLAAIAIVFAPGGRFDTYPVTISICVGLAFYLIFSPQFTTLKTRHFLLNYIGKLGIFPVILLAVVIAPLVGEAPWPDIQWGLIQPDFDTLWREYTVLGVGMPSPQQFVLALPTVAAAYIVLFGDVLQTKALITEANHLRPDKQVDYNPDRAHMIFGGRNVIMSIFGPDVTMAGPLWAAMQVVVIERYREGREAMRSIFGGSGSFRLGTNSGLLLLPIVSLVQPILAVALALTLLIQGFVSVRIGVQEARNNLDLGIAGIVAAVLLEKGAAWAFGVGIAMWLLIYGGAVVSGKPRRKAA